MKEGKVYDGKVKQLTKDPTRLLQTELHQGELIKTKTTDTNTVIQDFE